MMKKRHTLKVIVMMILIILLPLFITGFDVEENEERKDNSKFKDNVVFYAQHQDDETLWASAAILNAIDEVGADNVYIVQVSYGTGIKIFNKEKTFENLSQMEKYEYREREFLAAVNALGIKRENIILLPRTNSTGTTSFEQMERVALGFEKNLKNVTHVAHTYKLDWHLQHLKNGSIIQALYNCGKIKDAKYFIKPEYEKDIPNGEKIFYKATSNEDKEKIRLACEQYKIVDKEHGRAGIGYKSDHRSFKRLMENYDSILHTTDI